MQIDKQQLPQVATKLALAKTRREKLPDGTPYYGAKYYDFHDLSGLWDVALKIDGIRCIRDRGGMPSSRAGNHFLKEVAETMPVHMADAELFRKDWNTSMSLKAYTVQPTPEDWYSLDPIDSRLVLHTQVQLTHEYLVQLLNKVLEAGYEGLVLRQGTKWLKVVPLRSADVVINGWYEGTGKHKGMLGSFTTPFGSVGTGFDDALRQKCWGLRHQLIGKVIEVHYRERTKTGKLRMPVFQRFRFDKTGNSIE